MKKKFYKQQHQYQQQQQQQEQPITHQGIETDLWKTQILTWTALVRVVFYT